MILGEVFEQFVDNSPVSVMVHGLLENALTPTMVDTLFEECADRQYMRTLLFSDVVNLMGTVVCRISPSINAAYKKKADILGVTRKAVYGKIDRVELGTSEELVRRTAGRFQSVIEAMGGAQGPWLEGYLVKILDGSHLPGTEHRIKPLRTTRAGALPGQALVVFQPALGLVTDVVLCADGHAQERSLTDRFLAKVLRRDLWIADRNFCTTPIVFGIAGRQGAFVIRQHGSTLHWETVGKRTDRGTCDTGRVFEQRVRLTNDDGEILFVRRITVELKGPTRDGDRVLHILTNLPRKVAGAIEVAHLYRRRWTLETAFQELEASLNGEIHALGYPKAALFAFSLALVAYNVLNTVKAAVRSVHGPEVADHELSEWYLAEEVAQTHRGMMIAIPKDEWVVFHDLSAEQLGQLLQEMARKIRLHEYRKQPRGPKRPRPKRQSGAKIKHVATSKLLGCKT
jgi:IS4 transposase